MTFLTLSGSKRQVQRWLDFPGGRTSFAILKDFPDVPK